MKAQATEVTWAHHTTSEKALLLLPSPVEPVEARNPQLCPKQILNLLAGLEATGSFKTKCYKPSYRYPSWGYVHIFLLHTQIPWNTAQAWPTLHLKLWQKNGL